MTSCSVAVPGAGTPRIRQAGMGPKCSAKPVMRRTDCHDAIKQVMSSYEMAVRTVNAVIGIVVRQPDYLKDDDLSLVELRLLAGELHDIYFTRMFASFESGLRHRPAQRSSPVEALIGDFTRRRLTLALIDLNPQLGG